MIKYALPDVARKMTDVDAVEDGGNVLTSRKRVRHYSKWMRNSRKKLRRSGKEYVSTTGRHVPSLVIGGDCRCQDAALMLSKRKIEKASLTSSMPWKATTANVISFLV